MGKYLLYSVGPVPVCIASFGAFWVAQIIFLLKMKATYHKKDSTLRHELDLFTVQNVGWRLF